MNQFIKKPICFLMNNISNENKRNTYPFEMNIRTLKLFLLKEIRGNDIDYFLYFALFGNVTYIVRATKG